MSYRILDLMNAARKCVRDIVNVQKDENVLILTDRNDFADPLVVQAMGLACDEVGADVVFATCREYDPRIQAEPKIVQKLLLGGADIIFRVTAHEATLHTVVGRIAWIEYGVKGFDIIANTPDLMASEWARFPPELFFAICRKVRSQVRGGKKIRVTSPNGTDISAALDPDLVGMGFPTDLSGNPGPLAKGDGQYGMFPTGVFGIPPRDPANGIIICDALLGVKGALKEPVRITIENKWVTKVEGGKEAEWFWRLIQEYKRRGIASDYFVEIMWGLNPKASIEQGLENIHFREGQLTRRAGTLHFGIGVAGRGFHWDGMLVKPFTVRVDGETVIDKGRLTALDDPEVRAVAREYGDPDKLLTEVP